MAVSDFLKSPIEYLKGVGPVKGDTLKKELEIFTFEDLLFDFPFRYIDRTKYSTVKEALASNDYVQIIGHFTKLDKIGSGRKVRVKGIFRDNKDWIEVVWFQATKWILEYIKLHTKYVLYGKVTSYQSNRNIVHPELEHFGTQQKEKGLVPVYRSTEKLDAKGLDSKGRRKLIKNLLEKLKTTHVQENLPFYLLQRLKFESRYQTIKDIHFPPDHKEKVKAVNRIKFEELFFLQISLLRGKIKRNIQYRGFVFSEVGEFFHRFYKHNLPFELTNAQKKVMKEIRKDLGSGNQMNRLLQGDVGSGKTVVAVMSCLIAIDNGFQSCIMAPTEILAQQHFKSISNYIAGLGLKVDFLSGTVKGKRRREVLEDLSSGKTHILVGTHALIEDPVKFKNLGLSITDEQHRFGVAQRAKLWKKASNGAPHILVMTATPIPRTLAMTFYGDLDVSVIDELPPGRKPIRTIHHTESHRPRIVSLIRQQITAGRQVYVIFPLIEESEKLDLQNLQDGYEELLHYFPRPDYQIGVVHGRMKPDIKEYEMQQFINKKTQILVSTTVIEVGVDVPNATMMVIENAERFGLSQLHQLRGRVGRGGSQSYCLLVTSYKLSKQAKERIQIMCQTNSGFEIAEADLRLRGPGEIVGTRQSGAILFKLVSLATDQGILNTARTLAEKILEKDPQLSNDQNAPIRDYINSNPMYQKDWSRIS